MSKKLIVANWKMHFTTGQASLYLHKLDQRIATSRDVEVVLCPNMLALQSLSLQLNRRKFKLGAQNCYYKDEGAYTGEVSANMLRHLADYVILGHSERRHIFGETDKEITQKVQAVVRNDMKPILCVGETKPERDNKETNAVLHGQVRAGLADVTSEEMGSIVIAYEPVWAIGTGDFAPVEDVVAAVKHIRRQIKALFGAAAAENACVLYGGSVDENDAGAYLAAPGIDGLLVGGASLKSVSFYRIVEAARAAA